MVRPPLPHDRPRARRARHHSHRHPLAAPVQNIEPSRHRAGTAYVAYYRFMLGDFEPYIYRTDDFGKTWSRLTDGSNGIAKDEPTRVVREDPERANLLYAGTEFGMYLSFDNGANWQPFQLNLPATPVTDIKLAQHDLVLSTQGRSFWILDNLTPLHQLNAQTAAAPANLFAPRGLGQRPNAARAHESAGPPRTPKSPQNPPLLQIPAHSPQNYALDLHPGSA